MEYMTKEQEEIDEKGKIVEKKKIRWRIKI